MSETPVGEVCGRVLKTLPPSPLSQGKTKLSFGWVDPHTECTSPGSDQCAALGYLRCRAALSAAEKREARLREALATIAAGCEAQDDLSACDIPCHRIARAALELASAASEAQPPPAIPVPIASSTQEGEK